jgi:hypothetical protein
MRIFFPALALGLAVLSNFATSAEVACPAQISPSVIALNDVLAGWTSSLRDTPLELTGVNFSDGPPAEKTYLRENSSHENKQTLVTRQVFDSPALKGAYWLICEYADHTVFLAKPIPSEIAECTVIHSKRPNSPRKYQFRSLTCK